MGGENIVAFIAGIMFGFAAGALVANHFSERKLETETLNGAKKYMDISDELDKATYQNDQLKRKVDDLESKFAYEEARQAVATYAPESNDILDEMTEPEPPGPDDDDPDEDPILISEYDFLYRYPHTQSHAYTFYQGDGALLDESEEVVLSPIDIVGEEAMWALDHTEDDVIYIYNPRLELTFEIEIRHDESYYMNDFDEEDI